MNRRAVIRHPLIATLALAVGAALPGANAFAAPAPNGSPIPIAHVTQLGQGDAVVGPLPWSQPIHIEVALKLRDKQGLDALVASNAGNQAAHRPPQLLTSDQFLATHAPTPSHAQAVADYLAGKGFTHIAIAPNRMLVSADGTASSAGDAFATTFSQVRTRDGRMAYANNDEARIPASLGDTVLAVVGLQNVHLAQAATTRRDPDGAHPDAVILHAPTEFSAIYGGAGAKASNVVVGILTNASGGSGGQLSQDITDLNTFTSNHGVAPVVTSVVDVNGAGGPTPGNDVLDVASQDIVGIAGGQVKKLLFYNIPTTSDADLTAGLNTIVSQNLTRIVDVSYGICETDAQADGSAAADDAILETAVAQGQTFAVSTGSPYGADQCNNDTNTPRWPASSQYVVAVAGTQMSASTTSWTWERVYNASGGSPSTFEPMPIWQSKFKVAGTTRVAVDVAFDAYPSSGANVIENGAAVPVGGNTLAVALFTGAWATVLQARGAGFGFAAPVIYSLPDGDFHDITIGNNNGGRGGLGYNAGSGYDFTSGRGSIIIGNAIADSVGLGNKPPVAQFTASANGETVNFTDSSTDADGTIGAYAWTFGDGGTSTLVNPSHTYTSVGTFKVVEKVTDNDGATNTASQTIAVGPLQLIQNPGFESGTASPWTLNYGSALVNNPAAAHAGNWYAAIGDGPSSTGQVSQLVVIPKGETSVTLSFYMQVVTTDTQKGNHLFVKVFNETPPQGTTDLDEIYGVNSGGYVLHTYDMTSFAGDQIRIMFAGVNNSGPQETTTWSLDDVTLTTQ